MTTKLRYIRGVREAVQIGNIPGQKAAQQAIPFFGMTKGEADLLVLRDRTNILSNYYGDSNGAYAQAKTLIDNALGKDLRTVGLTSFTGVIQKDAQWAAAAVRKAAFSQTIIGGKPQADLLRRVAPVVAIAGTSVDNADLRRYTQNLLANNVGKSVFWKTAVSIIQDEWTRQGHHMMYEWASDSRVGLTSLVSIKRLVHKEALDYMSGVTEIPRSTLRMFTENGLMRCNIDGGLAPLDGGESVALHKETRAAQFAGIGAVDPATIALIVSIIKGALSVALLIAATVKELKTASRGYSTQTFAPEREDWLGDASDDLFGLELTPGSLLLGAGVALGSYGLVRILT